MPHRCPIKEAARKKRWYDKNKPRQQVLSRDRAAATRERRRSLLNFPCCCCGDPDQTVIQWHHVDESLKDFDLFGGRTPSEEDWWNESLKCIPVCANCHLKIHKNKLCLIPVKL